MSITESKIDVSPGAGESLDTVTVTTGAGAVKREAVFIGDPENPNGRGAVVNTDPDTSAYGSVVRWVNGAIVDIAASISNALSLLMAAPWVEAPSGRLRVVLDPLGGAQTLGTVTTVTGVTTVTTVSTVTNVSNLVAVGPASAGISLASFVADQMNNAYANQVLRCIS